MRDVIKIIEELSALELEKIQFALLMPTICPDIGSSQMHIFQKLSNMESVLIEDNAKLSVSPAFPSKRDFEPYEYRLFVRSHKHLHVRLFSIADGFCLLCYGF